MTSKSKALMAVKGDRKIVAKGKTLAQKEKKDLGPTRIGNYAYLK